MKLDVCHATQFRCKSLQLLRLARNLAEPARSDLISIGTEMARRAHLLSEPPRSALEGARG